jgi:hypothetical protein
MIELIRNRWRKHWRKKPWWENFWWENTYRKKQKLFYRRLINNLLFGISITVLLHSFDELLWLRQPEDDAIDWVMAMQRGSPPVQSVKPFAFLDIDEAAYRNWGEPLLIPRDKLLEIIEFAVSGNPALIVVDVDLSRPGQCDNHDIALTNFLNGHYGQGKPPIILPQLFSEPIEGESRRTLRKPFFIKKDNIVRPDTRVFLASPLFEVDESDFRLRRWRLWEVASNQEVVSSMELLAVALLRNPLDPASVFKDVEQNIKTLTQEGATPEPLHSNNLRKVEIANMKFEKDTEDIGQRILYTIPWTLSQGETYPDNFVRRSVLPITKKGATDRKRKAMNHLDSSWLKDHVVVIGASFKESRDIHATPIGQMPGAIVIVNAINSLYGHGLIKKPEIYWIIPIEMALIVIMSIAFAKFDSFLAMLISSVAVITLMLPFSFYLFKYGVWLNFVIPLFFVNLYEMCKTFKGNRTRS